MNKYLLILTIIIFPFFAHAQQSNPDSLRNELKTATADSMRFRLNSSLSGFYEEKNLDSAIFFGEQALVIARKNKKQLQIASALLRKAFPLRYKGKYGEVLECIIEALTILEDPGSEKNAWQFDSTKTMTYNRLWMLSSTHHVYALLEANMDNIDQELFHYKEEIRIAEKINASLRIQVAYMNLGNTYLRLNKPDSALYFALMSDSMANASGNLYYNGWNLINIGNVYFNREEYEMAKKYYYMAFHLSGDKENVGNFTASANRLFLLYVKQKNADSSLYFARQALNSNITKDVTFLTWAYGNLYEAYTLKGQSDSADKYLKLAYATRDSAYEEEIKNLTDFQHLSMNEQLRLRKLEKERVEYQGKVRTYSLLAGLGIFLIIALLLYRNNRQKRRSNKILENTLSNLRTTQSQLVQSEKMASLGELTAGIAHEIQNPLNFVNNFSEVNQELVNELVEEVGKGNQDEVKSIAADIKENSEKISHHGKRADAIVKSMLQHSRSGSGHKEPTDINALCDEYLRLAYHGLRAKDKSFQSGFETRLDPAVGNISVMPQEIGRVILNLINNAFYAVWEKKKTDGEGYDPKVTVTTRKIKDKVEIEVEDNGNGIPESVREKIFQPFFTTKPTGQGTGLGLSLSYDIVRAHGGDLRMKSVETEGTVFVIGLPA